MCQPSAKDIIKRNDIWIIHDFIEEKHGTHYHIINVHEDNYDKSIFHNKVTFLPFPDHCSPRISYFETVSQAIANVLKSDPQCTIFIHCKAGRGRSGTVYCAYQIHTGSLTAQESIRKVDSSRSPKNMCITIPSQIRFLHYYEHQCINGSPTHHLIRPMKIIFSPGIGREINFSLIEGIPYIDKSIYTKLFDGNSLDLSNEEITIKGEFVIELFDEKSEDACVRCQLHTDFLLCGLHKLRKEDELDVVHLDKNELDGPHHRSKGKNFPDGFSMDLFYKIIE